MRDAKPWGGSPPPDNESLRLFQTVCDACDSVRAWVHLDKESRRLFAKCNACGLRQDRGAP